MLGLGFGLLFAPREVRAFAEHGDLVGVASLVVESFEGTELEFLARGERAGIASVVVNQQLPDGSDAPAPPAEVNRSRPQ